MTEPLTIYQSEAEEKVLELVQAAQYAQVNADGMTDSDIQGAVMALVRKYVPEVRPH